MADENTIWAYATTNMIVAPGGTNAVLVLPPSGVVSSILKYGSGGTLEVIGVTVGTTYTAAQLAALPGTGYPMGAGEAIGEDGPVRYYLMCTGNTCTANLMWGKSAGN